MNNTLRKLTQKQWLIWIGLILFALFFFLNKELVTLLWEGKIDEVRNYLDKNEGYALFFLFLVMLIQNSFTVFPLILVITINITIFGFINGFLWSWITSVVASFIVYYCARYIFQEIIIEKLNKKLIKKIDTNGFAYVFQARIFPFVPTSIVNILAGVSTIKIIPFIIATSIGNFLYFFVLALIPAGILSGKWNTYVIWIVIFAVILFYYVIQYRLKKKNTVATDEELD